MTEHDLARIESELAVKLPKEYRRFARALPPARDDAGTLVAVLTDVDTLIEDNRNWIGSDWPGRFLSIGSHDGNHFFIDLHHPASEVFYFNHEEAFDPEDLSGLQAGSFDDLLRDVEAACGKRSSRLQAAWQAIKGMIAPAPRSPGFHLGRCVTWTADAAEMPRTFNEPTPDQIAAEIRRLFQGEFGALKFFCDPGATWFDRADLFLLGGGGRCSFWISEGKRTLSYFNKHGASGESALVETVDRIHSNGFGVIAKTFVFGEKERLTCPNVAIATDERLVVEAALHLHKHGELPRGFPVQKLQL